MSIVLGTALPPPGEEQAGWIEGVAIILSILVVTGCDNIFISALCLTHHSVASLNNWSKERKFRQLTEQSRKSIRVIVRRNGVSLPLSGEDLLVGDVIELNVGSAVPADGVYITGTIFIRPIFTYILLR